MIMTSRCLLVGGLETGKLWSRSRSWSSKVGLDHSPAVSPSNCQREVDNDVISGAVVDNVGVNVLLKFGDSRSNDFRDIRGAVVSNERTNEHGEATDFYL